MTNDSMQLADLLRDVPVRQVAIPSEPSVDVPAAGTLPPVLSTLPVRDVWDDSRKVQAGDLFVALPGQTVDGHDFVAAAAERGAVAAIVEHPVPVPIPQLCVENAARALATIAANRYGRPADALTIVAVTGTNGKTTTTHLIEGLLEEAGFPTGVIGTIAYRLRAQSWPAPFTTPTAVILQQTLAQMRDLGAKAIAIEASSHALALDRLTGVRCRVAAFTNLTQDHLDFHADMEDYFAAKARLFHAHLLPTEQGGRGVIFVDDPYGRRLADTLPAERRLTVSLSPSTGTADIWPVSERQTLEGTVATFASPAGEVTVQSRLTGRFNLANLAVGVGIGVALGLSPQVIARGLARVEGVAGRLERIVPPRPPTASSTALPSVFVDYSHTPDALQRALLTLRSLGISTSPGATGLATARGRLIVVFGCGGDRDAGKRPQMGRIAATEADVVIVTSDNPRSEDPLAIIDMIVAGITQGGVGRAPDRCERQALPTARGAYYIEPDRRQAIAAAIAAARPDDVVLIAGKGHEDYQIIGRTRHPFDDREEAARALAARVEPPSRPTLPGGVGSHPGSSPGIPSGSPASTVAPHIDLPLERVLQATGGRLARGGAYRFTAVSIDSRAILPGGLFVAIRGQKQDGHQFCAQAVSAGAAGLLVERGKAPRLPDSQPVAVIEVADTHVALGQIARAHREAPEIAGKLRVVAVTGSSGKTSTKELIAAILSTHVGDPAEVLKTEGNLNNHFGVPLTLLRLRPGQRYAVIEMGMSARGEIAYLTSLARPDVGVLTNVGPAHLETLGTLDNIAAAKGELFSGLMDGATAVFCGNRDHARVQAQAVLAGARGGRLRPAVTLRDGDAPAPRSSEAPGHFAPVVRYALRTQHRDGLEVELRCQSPDGAIQGPATVVAQVPLLGAHQADNAALAAAAALCLDVPPVIIAHGLSRVVQAKHRGQVVTLSGRNVLDDCYNANPASTAAALRTLATLRGAGRAIAILGDMLELGADEAALHAGVGQVAADCSLSLLITVGQRARHIAEAAAARGLATQHVESPQAAAHVAAQAASAGDWILIKGSRGMALEQVLDHLRALLSTKAPTVPTATS